MPVHLYSSCAIREIAITIPAKGLRVERLPQNVIHGPIRAKPTSKHKKCSHNSTKSVLSSKNLRNYNFLGNRVRELNLKGRWILSRRDAHGVVLNDGPINTRKLSEIASVNLDLDCRAYHDCSDRVRCVRRRLEIYRLDFRSNHERRSISSYTADGTCLWLQRRHGSWSFKYDSLGNCVIRIDSDRFRSTSEMAYA